MKRSLFPLIFLVFIAEFSLSEEQDVATLTKFYGKVRLFKDPMDKKSGKGPFAKIGSKYYRIYKAKKGHKLSAYERIQTGPKSKAKLVYENGDQITVSADTAYEVAMEGESGIKRPVLEMIFGKIRGLIRPGGPRTGMKVRSSSMVMGVRGTDFYVSARGKSGNTEISVLRGQVDVVPRAPDAKPLKVEAGFTVEVPKVEESKDKVSLPPIKVKPTTKSLVVKIFKETIITKKEMESMPEEATSEEVAQKLAKLEISAVEAVKHDIKVHDPDFYKQIEKVPAEKIQSADLLQAISTKKAFDAAPKAKKTKAKYDELEDSDTYDKYFKD